MKKTDMVWGEVGMYVVAMTDKAIGFGEEQGEGVDLWLPLSQIGTLTEEDQGDVDIDDINIDDYVSHVEMPLWLAEKHCLGYEEL